jgi:hypothetical protein
VHLHYRKVRRTFDGSVTQAEGNLHMKIKRSHAVVVLMGLGVTGIIGASAASLGGITEDDLGADAEVVGSCDTDGVTVTWGTAAGAGQYNVTSATIGGIDVECNGQTLKVSVFDASNASLGSSANVTVDATSETVTFGGPVDAEAVVGVAVVISGA